MSDKQINIPENAVDLVKSAYEDSIQPVVREAGQLISRPLSLLNALFAHVDCWAIMQRNKVEQVAKLAEHQLEHVDPDKIVSPEPYVAIPAVQAASYSMDSDWLRTLYANLLSKAMYSDTKDSVHPAFIEIIKSMSPLDCKVFDSIMITRTQEIGYYEIREEGESGTYHVMFPYITEFQFEGNSVDLIAASIDNLSRNKLITPQDFHYSDDAVYAQARKNPLYQHLVTSPGIISYKKAIKSTSFGRLFYRICCNSL